MTHDSVGTVSLSRVLTGGSPTCHAGPYFMLTICTEYKVPDIAVANNGEREVVFGRVIRGVDFLCNHVLVNHPSLLCVGGVIGGRKISTEIFHRQLP